MISLILSLDTLVLYFFDSVRTASGTWFFIGISEIGNTTSIVGFAAIAALLLALKGRFAYIAGLVLAVGGSFAVREILKDLVHRPRPHWQHAAFIELGYSFPSGHASASIALYGFLAYLVASMWPAGRARRAALIVLPSLALLISFGRVYLGVHWASDVIAGMLVGAVFAALGIWLTRMIERRYAKTNAANASATATR